MAAPDGTVRTPAVPDGGPAGPPQIEISDSRISTVGRISVRRALPRRGRRTVGAWCFADHMGPADVTENSGLDVGPHPHIGLQTVTWLIDGQVLHRDSLGGEQVIKPGQLNLMTAGNGVTHSEEATGHYRGQLDGIQLWIAQPDGTRHGTPAFEHHAELPRIEVDTIDATVLVGEFADTASPARHDTPLVGVDLAMGGDPGAVPLCPRWEYALIVLRGAVSVADRTIVPGKLAYLGQGRDEFVLNASGPTRALLLGGEPFPEPIVMWWNFVGRTQEDINAAYESWVRQDDRFGRIRSALPRIPAPRPLWWQPGQTQS